MKVHATFGTLKLVELGANGGFVDSPATIIDIESTDVDGVRRLRRLWLLGTDDGDMAKKLIIRGFNSLGAAYENKEAIRETVNAMHAAIRPPLLRDDPAPSPDADNGSLPVDAAAALDGEVARQIEANKLPPVVTGQGAYVQTYPKVTT